MDKVVKKTLDLVASFMKESKKVSNPVVEHRTAEELSKMLDLSLGREHSLEDLLPTIESFLKYSVRTGHPHFVNQLYNGVETPGIIGDLIQSAANTSLSTYEISPVATLLEVEMIERLSSIVGFEHGDGIFCTGGSNANLLAMLSARHRHFPEIKSRGYGGIGTPVAFVSDQAHYSFQKAANVLGIGQDNLVMVKSDAAGQMIPEALEGAIITATDQGKRPFFIGATAGTTVLGAFDPILQIAAIANKYNLWFHVDAAYGCAVLFSDKHKFMLNGIELADSLTWDFHKVLGVPMISSVILVKERGCLLSASSSDNAGYLFHDHKDSSFDYGRASLQCGRKIDSFKTWLMWKHYGDQGFADHLDSLMQLAQYATELVNEYEELELLKPTKYLAVNFRYNPGNLENLNELNLSIREKLKVDGSAMVNYSSFGDTLTIRLVLGNFGMTKSDVKSFFTKFLKTARELA